MRDVTVRWGSGRFGQDIEVGGHQLRADEDVDKGGDNSGPEPHEILLAALGACTAMTLKMYAERKGWPLRQVQASLNADRVDGVFMITRRLTLEGDLDDEQRQRLLEIADKCPVHKTLVGEVVITTSEVTK